MFEFGINNINKERGSIPLAMWIGTVEFQNQVILFQELVHYFPHLCWFKDNEDGSCNFVCVDKDVLDSLVYYYGYNPQFRIQKNLRKNI